MLPFSSHTPYACQRPGLPSMSSYLEKQSSAFRGTLASAAAKISNPTSAAAAAVAATASASSLAPGSPAPSQLSDSGTPKTKRKRDALPEVPYSQPQLTGYGTEVKTNMNFAVEYLKGKKGATKTLVDIMGHLGLNGYSAEHKAQFVEGLRGHPRIDWKPDANLTEQTWQSGTYKHRPIIPNVNDGTSLLAHLQRKTDASGVAVKDLKDGWPDCEDTLTALEDAHKIVVVRTKKDHFPRYVWPNDASLYHPVEPEFKQMWLRTPLPSLDDMHRKLMTAKLKPTSEDPRKALANAGSKPKTQKKRAGKRIGKATNVHMQHLMQDYSGLRR